jgi:predicted dehydrogenase
MLRFEWIVSPPMDSRRNFIGKVATGLGTLAASRVLGANERLRIGLIGAGDRGLENARGAQACPGTEIVAFADVFTRRLEESKRIAPAAKTYLDYRELLADPSIDAVIVSTPHHLHAEHFTAVMEAGKHCYQEKTMAFTVEDAKQMRAAYKKAANRVVQIGHQSCSSGQLADASTFLAGGMVGKVTAIQARMFRNTPHGKPPWSRLVTPDMTAENILWTSFLGPAPEREFDPHRYVNWRFFWDYSGGNVHENMSHQLAFWYKVMDLKIPTSVNMAGGIYLWKDGREVPDTMTVSMLHPEEILFTWDSGFGNNQPGVTEDVLGTDGAISKSQQIRYTPQKVNRKDLNDVLGSTPTPQNAHMQNFLDCIRTGKTPNCPLEIGFRTAIACRMAIESYRQGRTMKWDSLREEIV